MFSVCVCVCPACLPAACWPGPRQEPREWTWKCPDAICGEEGVKRYESLPGDDVAAEKEALQAGQEVHLSLEGERERGEENREKWRDVKRRGCSGRGHCISSEL